MMTERGRCPPVPPADFSADLPTIQLRANRHAWVRVLWTSRRPLMFSKSRHGIGLIHSLRRRTRQGFSTGVRLCRGPLRRRCFADTERSFPASLCRCLNLETTSIAEWRGSSPTRELTLIYASGLRLATFEEIVTAVIERPENKEWKTGQSRSRPGHVAQSR